MNYIDKKFNDERIELHGKSFSGCEFVNCELVYDGDRSPTFSNNTFIETKFTLTGAALRTLYFLGNMSRAGDGGKEIVDAIFSDIQQGNVHGHQVTTVPPHTAGHRIN